MKKTMIAVLALASLSAFAYDKDTISAADERLDPKVLGASANSGELLNLEVITRADLKKVTNAELIKKLNALRAASLAAKNSPVGGLKAPLVVNGSCGIEAQDAFYTVESKNVDGKNGATPAGTNLTNLEVAVGFSTTNRVEDARVDVTYHIYNTVEGWLEYTDTQIVNSVSYEADYVFGYSFDTDPADDSYFADAQVSDVRGVVCDLTSYEVGL